MITPSNFLEAIGYQGPRNFLPGGNGWGIFSRRSHLKVNGMPKVTYYDAGSAGAASRAMARKHKGAVFEGYKCIWCDGYHVGKNR